MSGNNGSDIHQQLIRAVELYLEKQGYIVRGRRIDELRRTFRGLAVPAIPDVIALKESRVSDCYGRKKTLTDQLIVEVEMNPTTASIKKKNEQYNDYLRGWSLVILDARKIRGMRKGPENITLGAIEDWLKSNL